MRPPATQATSGAGWKWQLFTRWGIWPGPALLSYKMAHVALSWFLPGCDVECPWVPGFVFAFWSPIMALRSLICQWNRRNFREEIKQPETFLLFSCLMGDVLACFVHLEPPSNTFGAHMRITSAKPLVPIDTVRFKRWWTRKILLWTLLKLGDDKKHTRQCKKNWASSGSLVPKQCFMLFGRQTFPVCTGFQSFRGYCQICDWAIWIQLKSLISTANCPITSVRVHADVRLIINRGVYRPIRFEEIVIHTINPFTPRSDQLQISPAASPEISHHTVWRTWVLITHSDQRWLCYQISLPHFFLIWEWKG